MKVFFIRCLAALAKCVDGAKSSCRTERWADDGTVVELAVTRLVRHSLAVNHAKDELQFCRRWFAYQSVKGLLAQLEALLVVSLFLITKKLLRLLTPIPVPGIPHSNAFYISTLFGERIDICGANTWGLFWHFRAQCDTGEADERDWLSHDSLHFLLK